MKASQDQSDRLHRFAHDLRNRLAAMQQVAVQLSMPDQPDRKELVAFAEQQYFKAMRATEELLDDLGVDRGVGQLKNEPIDLGSLVRTEIEHLKHRFERKQQVIQADLPSDMVVHADPHWIKQLVGALLSNASKFSHQEQRIDVRLLKQKDQAILEVSDTGIGMDAEDLAQVFVRYAMLKGRSTADEAQGRSTLARARQWAEAHHGALLAESAGPGEGSRFTLLLPLTQPQAA